MSVLVYGPVRMQVQKTEHFSFAPRYTEDGADYLYTEIDFGVSAVVNVQALATAGPRGIATAGGVAPAFLEDAPAQASGDALGITLRNIRPLLLAPRQNLTFSIGGNVVLSVGGPDAKNGPLVQPDTYVRGITGTATAFIYFHVKCWVQEFVPSASQDPTTNPNAARIVLANRYRITSILDENWYTTRHVSGQMIVDVGRLLAANTALGPDAAFFPITPDNFRQAAFLQIPFGFKRQNVQVTVASDNTTLDYSYTDEETPLALGGASLATKIEGYTTVGAKTGLATLGFVAKAVAEALRPRRTQAEWSWPRDHPVMGRLQPPMDAAEAEIKHEQTIAFIGGPPKLEANGIVRITGQRNANRLDLMTLGINILLNLFNTPQKPFFFQNGSPRFASLFVTQDIVERFVEVRGTFITDAYTDWKAWFGNPAAVVPTLVSFNSNLTASSLGAQPGAVTPAGVTPILDSTLAGINPPPPFGGGTRGNWLGAMVTALLSSPGQLPVQGPGLTAAVVDLGAFI